MIIDKKVYTEIRDNKKVTLEQEYITRICYAKPKMDSLEEEWIEGSVYDVEVQPMKSGKICIFKGPKHCRQQSGYRVYNTLDELKNDFYVKEERRMHGQAKEILVEDYNKHEGTVLK